MSAELPLVFEEPRKRGSVYLVEDSTGECVKVGFTTYRLHHRLINLRCECIRKGIVELTGAVLPLRPVVAFLGTLRDEQRILRRFAPFAIHNEWFDSSASREVRRVVLGIAKHRRGLYFDEHPHDAWLDLGYAPPRHITLEEFVAQWRTAPEQR
jgi:hypothetical protein